MSTESEIIKAVAHVLQRYGHDGKTRFQVMVMLHSIGDTITAEWALDELREMANGGANRPLAQLGDDGGRG